MPKWDISGLYRDPETLLPVEYYCKLPPDMPQREVIIVDPMLATGGSASAAIGFIKARGARNIKLMCLVGCPEGIKAVTAAHPDVDIFLAAVDSHLNDHGYIVPGLGDAGGQALWHQVSGPWRKSGCVKIGTSISWRSPIWWPAVLPV